ncbi:tigger transposable element-derived protein 5-like [Scyliorhinus canicula]|uniref:tigger transposable element-derived protein 5-like n=1 Tax=Scyliorhinus canicula TaxID=7830 RepID=UPI0018F65C34|nr:tigger transposable element-derived protein 5-like [Scyliorhinus canicula]
MIDSPLTVPDYLKAITIKDACYLAGKAWGAVTEKTIANCWNKALGAALPQPQHDPEEEDFLGFTEAETRAAEERLEDHLDENLTLRDWVNRWSAAEDDMAPAETFTEEEIIDQVVQEEAEEEEPQPTVAAKSHSDAITDFFM